MKFGTSLIVIAVLAFACLASATRELNQKYQNLLTFLQDNPDEAKIKKHLGNELHNKTILTADNLLKHKAKKDVLKAYLLFDQELQEAKEAHDAYDHDRTKDNEQKYKEEREEAVKALHEFQELDTDFKFDVDKELPEIAHAANTSTGTTATTKTNKPFYKNPLYITLAVVLILAVLACVWALFFRKKAEDL